MKTIPAEFWDMCMATLEVARSCIGQPDMDASVAMGADGTPTSRIDVLVESAALRYIGDRDLGYAVLSEEAGWRNGNGWAVILDPVDGTENAIRGIPFSAVSAALARMVPEADASSGSLDRIISVDAAFVGNMFTGDVFRAIRGEGASMNGIPLPIHTVHLENLLTSVYGWDLGGTSIQDFSMRNSNRLRSLGCASLELCLTASGSMSAFIQVVQPLRWVDVAAGQLILEEVGGIVTGPDGTAPEWSGEVTQRSPLLAFHSRAVMEHLFPKGIHL